MSRIAGSYTADLRVKTRAGLFRKQLLFLRSVIELHTFAPGLLKAKLLPLR